MKHPGSICRACYARAHYRPHPRQRGVRLKACPYTKAQLTEWYVVQKESIWFMAWTRRHKQETMSRWLHEMGIPVRPERGARSTAGWAADPTKVWTRDRHDQVLIFKPSGGYAQALLSGALA